jgi:hypothetical protein
LLCVSRLVRRGLNPVMRFGAEYKCTGACTVRVPLVGPSGGGGCSDLALMLCSTSVPGFGRGGAESYVYKK